MPPDALGIEGSAPQPKPPRTPEEIVRDIDAERRGFVEAVGSLRSEADALRARIFSSRVAGIAGGAVAVVLVLRRLRRRRRRRRG